MPNLDGKSSLLSFLNSEMKKNQVGRTEGSEATLDKRILKDKSKQVRVQFYQSIGGNPQKQQ